MFRNKLFIAILTITLLILTTKTEASMFKLSSKSIRDGGFLHTEQIYNGFGCTGGNISPDLKWEGAPNKTKSYALVVHDPDAPKENGWYHWIVINIPVNKTSLNKGERATLPALETLNDFNQNAYGGACPPKGHGKHRYQFTVYALDVPNLVSPLNSPPAELHRLIKSRALASSTITAIYGR